jgi:hypothetical protein
VKQIYSQIYSRAARRRRETDNRVLKVRLGLRGGLRCDECGALDDGRRGWTLRLDCDDELVPFCPECDEEQFGDS